MTESEQILLEGWYNVLTAQGAYFDATIKQLGHVHVPDAESVAFLEVDESLEKSAIEKAVAAFVRDGSWPALTHRQCLHLAFRARLAKTLIASTLLSQGKDIEHLRLDPVTRGALLAIDIRPLMPDLQNRELTIRFFLVRLWELWGGEVFLARMADDWLKTLRQNR